MHRLLFFLFLCCFSRLLHAETAMPIPTMQTDSLYSSISGLSDNVDAQARLAAYSAKYGTYTPKREMELTSVPLISFGFLAKGQKKNFRAARNNFIPSYKNGMDDYIQFAPAITTYALNLCGYEGRSSFKRLFFSSGFSFAFMGLFVNGIKYTASEMRPDGSTANSFPSGHTATAFTCATIMHKEYGLTRSPWFSVGAYSISTLTGIMRTLNNRHWISDILVGAGLGVISTDLGYMMADFWFKDKGINRTIAEGNNDLRKNPSFFKLSLGTSIISDIELPKETDFIRYAWLYPAPNAPEVDSELFPVATHGDPFGNATEQIRNYRTIKVGSATTVGAEAAYFINPYIGVGARARIATAPIYAEGLQASATIDGREYHGTGSASDVLSVTDWGAGVFASLPFTSHFAMGTKVMYGRRYMGDIDLSGACDVDYRMLGEDINLTIYGDALELSAPASDMISTGISATYTMGNGVALSVFWDYDYTHTNFDCSYWPESSDPFAWTEGGREFSFKQRIQSNTIGASMTVMF